MECRDDNNTFQRLTVHHPEKLQFYSCDTPNGMKVACALEELQIPYEPHALDIRTKRESRLMLPFLSINPNGKIPALVDGHGDEGKVTIFESGACLMYIAEKYGTSLLPTHGPLRYDVLKWLFW